MADTHETIDDIIAEMRNLGKLDEKSIDEVPRTLLGLGLRTYADRLDAARKREVDKLNSVIQATVSRSDAEIDRLRREIAELKQAGNAAHGRELSKICPKTGGDFGQLGNAAKLREACANIAEYARSAQCHTEDAHVLGYLNQIEGWAKAALATPARNCDLPEVAKGQPKLAEQAWRVFKRSHKDSHLDAYGLLRCIRWLLAPATEKEATMETNNKLREALSDACYAMFNFLKAQNGGYEEMANALDKAKAALAAPPRNCDVGTAEEQYKRFMNMCNGKDVRQCAECSMRGFTPGCSRDRCFANWAQRPYDEGCDK